MKKVLSNIRRLTNQNHHTFSIMELAKFLNEPEAEKRLEEIYAGHNTVGYLTYDLIKERYGILNKLLEKVKSKYGEDTYNKFYSAF